MKLSALIVVASAASIATHAHAVVTSFATPAALEAFVGGPLLAVPDDGLPIGTLYGTGGGFGLPLATPFGPMSFAPVHDKVAPGVYHPFVPFALAGSDVLPPAGAVAIDFVFTSLSPGSFVFTGVGSLTTSAPLFIPGVLPGVPIYIGFGAAGESIDLITIETAPFGHTPPFTWELAELRVLPAPAGLAPLALAALLTLTRRRR